MPVGECCRWVRKGRPARGRKRLAGGRRQREGDEAPPRGTRRDAVRGGASGVLRRRRLCGDGLCGPEGDGLLAVLPGKFVFADLRQTRLRLDEQGQVTPAGNDLIDGSRSAVGGGLPGLGARTPARRQHEHGKQKQDVRRQASVHDRSALLREEFSLILYRGEACGSRQTVKKTQ